MTSNSWSWKNLKTCASVATLRYPRNDSAVVTLFFRKFCFKWRILHIELIWYTNHPNVHIHCFGKRWSFIWGCFFPESILNGIPEWLLVKVSCKDIRILNVLVRNGYETVSNIKVISNDIFKQLEVASKID